MVSAEHRVQICVCLALILCLRLAGCRSFERREILAKFFKAPVHLLDDTMKALLDIATPTEFVEAFLDDTSSGLALSRLPLCFGVLRDVWQSWCRRHRVTPEIHAACYVFRSRLLGNGHRMVPASAVHEALDRISGLLVQDEESMRSVGAVDQASQVNHRKVPVD